MHICVRTNVHMYGTEHARTVATYARSCLTTFSSTSTNKPTSHHSHLHSKQHPLSLYHCHSTLSIPHFASLPLPISTSTSYPSFPSLCLSTTTTHPYHLVTSLPPQAYTIAQYNCHNSILFNF